MQVVATHAECWLAMAEWVVFDADLWDTNSQFFFSSYRSGCTVKCRVNAHERLHDLGGRGRRGRRGCLVQATSGA